MIHKHPYTTLLTHQPLIKYIINQVSLLCLFLYFFYLFSGYDVGLFHHSYDSWRFLQILLFVVLFCLLYRTHSFDNISFYAILLWLTILILSLISISLSQQPIFAITDFATYLSLVFLFNHLTSLSQYTPKHYNYLINSLAFLPILSAIWPIVILIFIPDLTLKEHGNFNNIRYFDDSLLICLFFLWFSRTQPYLKKFSAIIWVISTLYLLNVWFDGARAVALSILIGCCISFSHPTSHRKNHIIFIASSIGFSYLASVLIKILNADRVHNLYRTSSSKRIELWQDTIIQWLDNPIFGTGGGNFIFYNRYSIAHPHNTILQWLAEWGLAGMTVIIICAFFILKLYKNRQNIHPLILGACFAQATNAMLSGTLVYPHTQILTVILFAYAWQATTQPTQVPKKNNTNKLKYIFTIPYLALMPLLVYILYDSFSTYSNIPKDIDPTAKTNNQYTLYPRLWQDGTLVYPAPAGHFSIFKKTSTK